MRGLDEWVMAGWLDDGWTFGCLDGGWMEDGWRMDGGWKSG